MRVTYDLKTKTHSTGILHKDSDAVC